MRQNAIPKNRGKGDWIFNRESEPECPTRPCLSHYSGKLSRIPYSKKLLLLLQDLDESIMMRAE